MKNLIYEEKYQALGYKLIAGVDEAGRGPLAGPVVAAAVILKPNFYDERINDSKKLSKKMREKLKNIILENAIAYSISIVSHEVIDEINILEASRLAMKDAISKLDIKPDFVLTDYMNIDPIPHEPIVKGDAVSFTIAAASILAKTKRDELMKNYHELYPEYDFLHNQGYGTKKHLEAINQYGLSPIHRKTFKLHK